MPIKHIWSALCLRSVVDSRTNTISLFDVFEQISIAVKQIQNGKEIQPSDEPKAFPFEYAFVSLWTKDTASSPDKEARADVSIELWDPVGKKISQFDYGVVIASNSKRLRSITSISNLFVTSPGVYWFKVIVRQGKNKEDELVAEIPLEVSITFD